MCVLPTGMFGSLAEDTRSRCVVHVFDDFIAEIIERFDFSCSDNRDHSAQCIILPAE